MADRDPGLSGPLLVCPCGAELEGMIGEGKDDFRRRAGVFGWHIAGHSRCPDCHGEKPLVPAVPNPAVPVERYIRLLRAVFGTPPRDQAGG